MSARFVIIDHDVGNKGDDYENACHRYRVAFWLPCPDSLRTQAAARKPIRVYVPSRSSSHTLGYYSSNVEGKPCGGCPGGVEPVTHVANADPADVARIKAGELLEFVIPDAGGHIPDHFEEEAVFACLRDVYNEIAVSLAEVASRAQVPQKRLIGKHVPMGGE